MYYDGGEKLRSMPASWTDIALPDSLKAAGQGRAHFRTVDLLQVAERVNYLLAKLDLTQGCV